ncbi:SDR family NAD(P)-dependent oxidoreductase [Mucilaginibacter aquatilis]|uniref:SDR family NAD(P)-dependent oxidoreductase n=1 Tax=Mucilaginibacter aquatilis TaxID=1517760 RepID=A0A6I4I8B6_9SPHI|nr:SDR family oxidoreductase [Mucilaginibacter aquatilis]MVN89719.1 SDR family NAD(P)-dependent oxidoreductase [Mucilaginibacter aquatilis]
MLLDFSEKTVLITGGSRGIGKACAMLFASLNADVIITYNKNLDDAERTITQLPHRGNHALYQLDQSKPKCVQRFFDKFLDHYPQLDVLVNNAGIYLEHKIEEIEFDEWQHTWQDTINTNLNGVANLCYFASRQMMHQGGGKIINISSRGAFRGEPNHPAYAASKAGLNAMSQSLAVSLAPSNISVHIIAPGFVETDMTASILNADEGEEIKKQSPFNRVAATDEVARLAAVYASEGFEFTSGGIIDINGASYLRT